MLVVFAMTKSRMNPGALCIMFDDPPAIFEQMTQPVMSHIKCGIHFSNLTRKIRVGFWMDGTAAGRPDNTLCTVFRVQQTAVTRSLC